MGGGGNLFGLTLEEIRTHLAAMGLPPYRGRQVYRWIYARGVGRFEEMSDLPRALRSELAGRYDIRHPHVVERHLSRDGTTRFLFALEDGRNVEAVYIPDLPDSEAEPQRSRHTVCLSTQVGCPLRCSFCYSGTVAFARNLTVGEILGQFLQVKTSLSPPPSRFNVVYMGMGEPLLNTKAVLGSLKVLTDPDAFAVSPRRVTVSTAGLADALEPFLAGAPAVGLAVSLHATTDETRGRIMPINRKHDLGELLGTVRRLPHPKRRKITFEYVLLGGENDGEEDARRLAHLLKGMKAKVNLIAYNPWPGSPHRPSTREATGRFVELLAEKGYTVSLRRSRGEDVLAACGQLALNRKQS